MSLKCCVGSYPHKVLWRFLFEAPLNTWNSDLVLFVNNVLPYPQWEIWIIICTLVMRGKKWLVMSFIRLWGSCSVLRCEVSGNHLFLIWRYLFLLYLKSNYISLDFYVQGQMLNHGWIKMNIWEIKIDVILWVNEIHAEKVDQYGSLMSSESRIIGILVIFPFDSTQRYPMNYLQLCVFNYNYLLYWWNFQRIHFLIYLY